MDIPQSMINSFQYSTSYDIYFSNQNRILLHVPFDEKLLFLNNFNVSFAFLLIPMCIAVFCFYRLSKFKNANPNLDVGVLKPDENVSRLFALTKYYSVSLEVLLLGAMVSVTNFVASAAHFLTMEGSWEHWLNLTLTLLGLLIYAAVFLKLFLQTYLFKTTVEDFKNKKCIYLFYLLFLFIVAIYMFAPFFLNTKVFMLICIPCIFGMFLAFVMRPFNKKIENIRFCVNIVVLSAVIGFRIFAEYFLESTGDTVPVWVFCILLNLVILPLSQIFNICVSVFNVWHLFKGQILCTCGENREPNECLECLQKEEELRTQSFQLYLENMGFTKNNLVVSGKQLVSDLDKDEIENNLCPEN